MVLKNPNKYEIGKTIVYFVRHGHNLEFSEDPKDPGKGLSREGIVQAKKVAKEFSKMKGQVDRIYSSTLLRATQTAEEISKQVGKNFVQYEGLCEFNKKVWKMRWHKRKFWIRYGRFLAAQRCFKNILEENCGKVIIIVAHGNIIKGLIGKMLGIPFKRRGMMDYDYCNISKVQMNGSRFEYLYYYNSPKIA